MVRLPVTADHHPDPAPNPLPLSNERPPDDRTPRNMRLLSHDIVDLRRSFVSSLLDAGLDLATVQKLVGYASPDTTVRYDLRGNEVARCGAALHHIPHRRRGG